MSKILRTVTVIAILLGFMGLGVGCGGGPIRTGGMGIFSPEKLLPDEVITINDLPPAVKALAEAKADGHKIELVTRNARTSDGRRFYTITYSNQEKGLTEARYWHNGELIYQKALNTAEKVN